MGSWHRKNDSVYAQISHILNYYDWALYYIVFPQLIRDSVSSWHRKNDSVYAQISYILCQIAYKGKNIPSPCTLHTAQDKKSCNILPKGHILYYQKEKDIENLFLRNCFRKFQLMVWRNVKSGRNLHSYSIRVHKCLNLKRKWTRNVKLRRKWRRSVNLGRH